MDHGRDHQNRQSHSRSRSNNTPPTDPTAASEQQMIQGKGHVVPHDGRVGAQAFQGHHTRNSAHQSDPAKRTGSGSDVAPTRLAEEREQERHRLEREVGRTPAGEAGRARDQRAPEVTRAALDEAAREADRRVVGHELKR